MAVVMLFGTQLVFCSSGKAVSDSRQQNTGSNVTDAQASRVAGRAGQAPNVDAELDAGAMNIGELAHAAGVTRRVVRFYIQRELLEPPVGKGRGSFYHSRHLTRLLRIKELQSAGHSLEAIGILLDVPTTNSASFSSAPSQRRETENTTVRPRPDQALPLDHDIAGGSGTLLKTDEQRSSKNNRTRVQSRINAELWTRLEVAPGAELHLDMSRHRLQTEKLKKLKTMIMIELDG